jgi:hypothetical protein
MKIFTTLKVGYSTSAYGCSNEYFTTIIINTTTKKESKKYTTLSHKGLYGSDDRINRALENKGFSNFYTPSQYGKITGKDKNWVGFLSEYEALDLIAKL